MRKIDKLMKKASSSERLTYILRTVIIAAVSAFVCLLLNQAGVMKENVLMVFLIGVLLIGAFTAGYEYGIFGAVVSVLLFNYFFTVPVHTFAIMDPDDVALMALFLAASCISSGMTQDSGSSFPLRRRMNARRAGCQRCRSSSLT